MLRFFSQRLIYIISICILIIFSIYLGMGMVYNSVAQNPSFNLVRNGQRAWNNTIVYIEDLFTGDLGQIHHERFGQIAIWDLLKDTYLNSMGLLATALIVSTVLGFLFGVFEALIKNKMILMALLLRWKEINEKNLPDTLADEVITDRLENSGKLISATLMMLAH
jgi:ABC-type dipeptide/oligopeptide/nickel transport system permease component